MYADREDAGEALARELSRYRGRRDAVVAAIPRGGVAVGAVVARRLGLELDVLLAKKLGHPESPEFAVGVVNLTAAELDEELIAREGIDRGWVDAEIARIRQALRRRDAVYRQGASPSSMKGRIVILVDDGVATGRTILGAARLARLEGAARVVIAVPVCSPDTLPALEAAADEVVCPLTPSSFFAIGQFYDSFDQVDDDEAVRLVREAAAAHARAR